MTALRMKPSETAPGHQTEHAGKIIERRAKSTREILERTDKQTLEVGSHSRPQKAQFNPDTFINVRGQFASHGPGPLSSGL